MTNATNNSEALLRTAQNPKNPRNPKNDKNQNPRVPMRRIVRLFKPYRWSLGFVLLLVAASSLVSLVNPFLIRAVIDVALPQGRTGLLSILALAMIVVAIANSSFSVSQTYVSTKVGQRVMHDLRTAVYSHLQRMSLAFFTKTRTGEVQSRIANDIGGMQATVTTTATALVSNATTVIAAVIAMAVLDWRLTIASLIMLPFFVWVSRRVGTERRRITRDRQRKLSTITTIVQESLSVSGIMLGHTMGRSRSLTDSFATESQQLSDLEIASSMAGRWRQSTIQIVMSAMPAVIYWVTGLTGHGDHMAISIGTLVAFTTLQQSLFRPAVQLMSTGVDIQSSLELFGRIFEYLDLPVDIEEPEHPTPMAHVRGEVRLDNVGFTYDGSAQPTLQNIDVTVPAGHSLAIVGETGSGKTTLSYLIPRLYDVSAAACGSTASTCATCPSTTSPTRSAWSRRRPTSSTPRSPTTCGSPSPTPPTRSSSRRPRRRRSTTTWRRCPTATTPWSASAATGSPAARSSAWRSPGRCSATRRSWSSTRPPAPSTTRPSRPSRRPSTT